MSQDKDYELLDFEFFGGKKKLKVILTYYNGVPKVDIREYYLDLDENVFRHTKKGVQLDPQRAEALRSALEVNAGVIDRHLLRENLTRWASKIKKIETVGDFFSHFEFFKCSSDGSVERIVFNSGHSVGKRLIELEKECISNEQGRELLSILKRILIAHQHSLSQFDEDAKLRLGDFIQDQSQVWSTLLKRLPVE